LGLFPIDSVVLLHQSYISITLQSPLIMSHLMDVSNVLQSHYPWTQKPLISSAPMRLIAGPSLALAVSRAGGLGFIGAGTGPDLAQLSSLLEKTSSFVQSSPIPGTPEGLLPVGVGFITWGGDITVAAREFKNCKLKPAAVWLFAPKSDDELAQWTREIRMATEGKSKIWIQVGSVALAVEVAKSCKPDVLVIQGSDAGGHGLSQSSSIINLVPEVEDALATAGFPRGSIPLIATGGISDGRGVAAALMLGASGVCLGTRFLATPEAEIKDGYKKAVIDADDGGINTVRTKLYDNLRGTTGWPDHYNGRGVINKSFRDHQSGMAHEENVRLYEDALKLGDEGWGKESGRITTYAGTGVGLVKDIMPAGQVITQILNETKSVVSSRSLAF
jgi:nitronate monooxygenase